MDGKTSVREAILAGREMCPAHEACTRDWGITNVDEDVCMRELNSTVKECPSLVREGDSYAYQAPAT
jgi:hypothetical protein